MRTYKYILITIFLFAANLCFAQQRHSGFTELSGKYDENDLTLKVWYPTFDQPKNVNFGYFNLNVAMNGAIGNGTYGLVIISHGDGGSDLSHRNLGEFLSKQGYIVAAVLHPNNNYKQNKHSRRPTNWIHRPKHIKAALDLIEQSQFHPFVNKNSVTIIGHSAGSYTAIASVGGKADVANIDKHCSKNLKRDAQFCDSGILGSISALFSQSVVYPVIDERDKRITAAIALAPMGVQFYGPGLLDNIDVPVLLLGAEHDTVLPRIYHAEYLAKNIETAVYEVFSNAGHYSFIAPFPSQLDGMVGDADKDPPGLNRQEFQQQLEARILRFLNSLSLLSKQN